jgi:hypothetical protein
MQDLKNKTDNELIKEIQSEVNITKNFCEICSRHSGIFFKMASKYISPKFKEKRLDFFNDKEYYIYQAIRDFNENKNTKFSTYLANRIMWICINDYNKEKKKKELNFSEEFLKNCPDETESINREMIEEVMKMLKKEKDKRVYKIFAFRYLEGKHNSVMPWKDVCCQQDINLSVQGCINVHNKYLNKLRKKK